MLDQLGVSESGMRFQHLLIATQGLRGHSVQKRASLKRRIAGAKWRLWLGQRDRLRASAMRAVLIC